jgi:hypothetical protein
MAIGDDHLFSLLKGSRERVRFKISFGMIHFDGIICV